MKKLIVVTLVGCMSAGLLTGCGFSIGKEIPLSEAVDTVVSEKAEAEPTVVEVETESSIEEETESEEDVDMEVMNEIANEVFAESMSAEGDYDLSAYPADIIGSYNGVNFSSYGSDIQVLFDDGWAPYDYPEDFAEEYVNEEETTSLSLVNDKYDDASFLVCVSYSLARMPKDEYIAELTENGFFTYRVDAAGARVKPDMTFNGLTWGATEEDVKAAYGEPDSVFEGSLYNSFKYNLTEDMYIELYVYNDQSNLGYESSYDEGLQQVYVSMTNFSDM